jgi:hypothetical protein
MEKATKSMQLKINFSVTSLLGAYCGFVRDLGAQSILSQNEASSVILSSSTIPSY